MCVDGVIRGCILKVEMISILKACHSPLVGACHGGTRITHKILQCGYYLLTIYMDAHDYGSACDQCQRQRNIS